MRLLVGLALLSLLGLPSCTKQDDVPESGTDVYMSFQMSQVASGSGVRVQGSSPSINTDVKDREDFVSRFGVFIFETGASGTKVAEKFSEYAFFVMKFKKGIYDFYFIANYPPSDETSLSQMSKSQLETYLQTLKPYALYHVPSSAGPFFPMARVYRDQTISGDGTLMAPIPFRPVVGTTNQLIPISSLGNDWQSTSNIQDQVRLVRANAKIDLTINGEGAVDVAKVEYYNAAANYTFAELNSRPASQALLTSPLVFNYTAPTPTTGVIQTKLYVPERLFNATEIKGWDTATDQAQGGVNYIQIIMKSGRTYRVPVVSNGPETGYQTFAKDATRADYNVIRNHHYKYEIAIAKDSKELVVKAVVLPWTLVESEISFGKIVFEKDFTLPPGTSMSGDKIIEVHQQTSVKVKFRLKGPKGAIWRATLTNGLDFSLQADGTSSGGVTGIADPDTEYVMVITPLKPFEGTPRVTEFYITVNGAEVPLVTGSEEIGPGKRYVFKQVE